MRNELSAGAQSSRRQIVFNWLMRDGLTDKDGWWGGVEEVALVDELLSALDKAAAPPDILALRNFCGEMYQIAGALGAPANVLDNLSCAAHGLPLPHETLLPFRAPDVLARIDGLLAKMRSGEGWTPRQCADDLDQIREIIKEGGTVINESMELGAYISYLRNRIYPQDLIADDLEKIKRRIDGDLELLGKILARIDGLAEEWRRRATTSMEEAGRIRRTVVVATEAEANCMVRAELWDKCADELAALRDELAKERP